ncbi:hypothetical protein V5F77_10515 [Xanthobacter sp. DSM 24535]|uniref:hypothetical protein n=1 Tax=Roseixanthobacter psychrophilus TaxID=3119917 RepID=UPI00372851C1
MSDSNTAQVKQVELELLDDDVVRLTVTCKTPAQAEWLFEKFADGLETGHLLIQPGKPQIERKETVQ